MYCTKCGAENPDDAHRCLACGYECAPDSYAAQGSPVKTCGLAVASLILAILTLFTCGITTIPAMICGAIALIRITRSQGQLKGNGLAIAGLIMSGIAILLIPVFMMMAAILMPAISSAKDIATKMVCQANLQQMSAAVRMYANDNADEFPIASEWGDLILPYVDSNRQVFRCPTAPDAASGYAFNNNLDGLKIIDVDPRMVVLFEADAAWNQSGDYSLVAGDRHTEQGCHVVYADGTVEFVETDRLGQLKWKPERLE